MTLSMLNPSAPGSGAGAPRRCRWSASDRARTGCRSQASGRRRGRSSSPRAPAAHLGHASHVDLQQREVVLTVLADDRRRAGDVVLELDVTPLAVRALDHVVVGEDVAGVVDQEARPRRDAALLRAGTGRTDPVPAGSSALERTRRRARRARRSHAAVSPDPVPTRAARRSATPRRSSRGAGGPVTPSARNAPATHEATDDQQRTRCRERSSGFMELLPGPGVSRTPLNVQLKRARRAERAVSAAAGGLDVRRAHQRLADQHRVDAGLARARSRSEAVREAGLRDDRRPRPGRRAAARTSAGCRPASVVRSRLLIPISRAPMRGGALELRLVVNLDQRREPERHARLRAARASSGAVERRRRSAGSRRRRPPADSCTW